MGYVQVGKENSTPIEIYYEDHGSGRPIVLIAGWPLDSRSWEGQLHASDRRRPSRHHLRPARLRPLESDRPRGMTSTPWPGIWRSSWTSSTCRTSRSSGSRSAPGELARYIGTEGTGRLRSCVFIESLAPSFTKSDANPKGVDRAAVEEVQAAILADRPAWLTGLVGDLMNLDENLGSRVSEEMVRTIWDAAADASPWATWASPELWLDDFDADIERIDIPTLILHGAADRILSVEGQARRLHAALPEARLRRDRGRTASGRGDPSGRGEPRAVVLPGMTIGEERWPTRTSPAMAWRANSSEPSSSAPPPRSPTARSSRS